MPTILTKEQADARLNSSNNLVSRFGAVRPSGSPISSDTTEAEVTIIPIHRPGRAPESPNFTPEEKVSIATRTGLGEGFSSVARDLGTTASVVRNIDNGHTKVDRKKVNGNIEQIQDIALLKLLASMNYIDDEKLKKANAKDLSGIAANMSKVLGNTREKEEDGTKVHLHLYAPELRSEASFKVIEVRGS